MREIDDIQKSLLSYTPLQAHTSLGDELATMSRAQHETADLTRLHSTRLEAVERELPGSLSISSLTLFIISFILPLSRKFPHNPVLITEYSELE